MIVDILYGMAAGLLVSAAVWVSVARLRWELRVEREEGVDRFWEDVANGHGRNHYQ